MKVAQTGEPALGVAAAYAGMSLAVYWLLILALAVAAVVVVVVTSGTRGTVAYLVILAAAMALALLLVTNLKPGALVATPSGLEFTPYDYTMRVPKPQAAYFTPWAQVRVRPGFLSTVEVNAGRKIEVGPRGRRFAEAIAGLVRG